MTELGRVEIFDKPETRRRWWKPSEQVRWMLRGALYAVAVVALLVVLVVARVVWVRSYNGELAYEYIQQVIQQQQAQQERSKQFPSPPERYQQQQQEPKASQPPAKP